MQDLAKWDSLLYTEAILSNKSKAALWAPTIQNSGRKYPYGFGWSTWTINSKKIIDHTGITGTQITRLLDDSITVVVLTNLGTGAGSAADSWGIGPQVADLMGYSPFVNENHVTINGSKAAKKPLDRLKALVGTYKVSNGTSNRKIYVESGNLYYEREKIIINCFL